MLLCEGWESSYSPSKASREGNADADSQPPRYVSLIFSMPPACIVQPEERRCQSWRCVSLDRWTFPTDAVCHTLRAERLTSLLELGFGPRVAARKSNPQQERSKAKREVRPLQLTASVPRRGNMACFRQIFYRWCWPGFRASVAVLPLSINRNGALCA